MPECSAQVPGKSPSRCPPGLGQIAASPSTDRHRKLLFRSPIPATSMKRGIVSLPTTTSGRKRKLRKTPGYRNTGRVNHHACGRREDPCATPRNSLRDRGPVQGSIVEDLPGVDEVRVRDLILRRNMVQRDPRLLRDFGQSLPGPHHENGGTRVDARAYI